MLSLLRQSLRPLLFWLLQELSVLHRGFVSLTRNPLLFSCNRGSLFPSSGCLPQDLSTLHRDLLTQQPFSRSFRQDSFLTRLLPSLRI